jgi:hypothetical protein
MARGACNFRETDLKRAIKAVLAADLEIARIEIEKDGRIILVPGKPPESQDNESPDELAQLI